MSQLIIIIVIAVAIVFVLVLILCPLLHRIVLSSVGSIGFGIIIIAAGAVFIVDSIVHIVVGTGGVLLVREKEGL